VTADSVPSDSWQAVYYALDCSPHIDTDHDSPEPDRRELAATTATAREEGAA